MTLPIDKRYEIVFISQYPMESQLGEKAVVKEVKCAKSTVQYWHNRWKGSKDPSDKKCSGRACATTETVDQRISELADSYHIATTGNRQNVLKRQNIRIGEETIR